MRPGHPCFHFVNFLSKNLGKGYHPTIYLSTVWLHKTKAFLDVEILHSRSCMLSFVVAKFLFNTPTELNFRLSKQWKQRNENECLQQRGLGSNIEFEL